MLKPVFSLAIVPQNQKITALGRRTWNVLLHIAQEQGLERDKYRAPLTDIMKGLDFNSGDQKIIKGHLRAMVSTLVEWQSPTQGEWQTWDVCGMLSHARLIKERGQNWVEWSYAVNMRNELLDPDIFAKLSLDVISQFSSHPGVALYEICSRYLGVGQTSRKEWGWWRPVLLGRPDDERLKKLEYRIFKRDTLRPAIAEINAVSDIEVEMIEYRAGRFISDLQFTVKKKPQRALALRERSATQPVDVGLLTAGEKLGIDHSKTERLVEEFGEEVVAKAMEATQRRAQSEFPDRLRDPLAYLKTVLPGHAAAQVEAHEKARAERAPEVVAANTAEKVDQWGKHWVAERTEQLAAEISALPADRLASLVEQVRIDLIERKAHPAMIKRLGETWTHPMVRFQVVQFYATAVHGEGWNKPTAEQVLEVAARNS